MKRLISIVCAAVLVPALAAAQPTTPDGWYKEGETQYNLGNFTKAVDAFKKGYELEPDDSKKAAYLFNVAQAYRQAKDCGQAVFFYKRYLALKENDTKKPLKPEKRQEIETRIQELDECAKQQEAIRNKPPDSTRPEDNEVKPPDGDPNKKVAVKAPPEEEEEEDSVTRSATPTGPTVLSIRAAGGAAKLSTGDIDVPIQATVALIGGYPLAINDKLSLELGAGFTFTPVPYETMGTSKSAKLIGVLANVGVTYEVAPKLGLRADLGLGGLFFAGVSESVFTDGAQTSGALTMFHLRAAVSAEYAITPNFIATAIPFAFSFSPAKTGLREDITSITAIDFMVGLGYRM